MCRGETMIQILSFLFLTFISSASAQNVTCTTRPTSDNSNACASTAFVKKVPISTIQLPAFVGGDCTTSAGSVILTCTKSGGAPFSPFATGTDAANLTGTLLSGRLPAFTGDCSVSGGTSVINCGGFAAVAHSGSASDITTGTLPLGVIPTSILAGAGTPGSLYATPAAGVATELSYASKIAGSGGTNGTYNVTITAPAGGANAVVQFVVSGGAVSGTPSVTTAGSNFTSQQVVSNAALVAAGATGLTGASITLNAGGGVSFGAYYWVISAVPGAAMDLYSNVAGVATAQGKSLASGDAVNPLYAISSSVNQFNYTAITEGFEVYATGAAIQAYPTSSVSGPIYVSGQSTITISGLSGVATVPRGVVFYSDDAATIISRTTIPGASVSGTVAVPAGAVWAQFTTRSRESAPTYSNIQFQYGSTATGLVSYSNPNLLKIFGYDIYNKAPVTYTGQKNLFDKTAAVDGYEVYGDGTISPEGSSSISALIFVAGQSSITVSGQQAPNGFANTYGVFYGADGTTVVQAGLIWPPGTSKTLSVPSTAYYFRFSPKQRNADPDSFGAIQVEYGTGASTYAAYQARILTVNGSFVQPTYTVPTPAYTPSGKKFLIFGDSKTETATLTGTVSSGTYTENTRENWPKFTMVTLNAGSWKNYATSGANFSYGGGLTIFQFLQNQITRAYNDAVSADVVIVDAGTNDQGNGATLGSVTTAMGKAIGALDNTVVLEAMRLDFYYIRTYWPNAKCIYVTPQQRAAFTVAQQQVYIAPMVQMAQIYGCEVIDQNSQLDIVSEFESVSGLPAGRYLRDGLHETTSSDTLPTGITTAGTVYTSIFMSGKISNALTLH